MFNNTPIMKTLRWNLRIEVTLNFVLQFLTLTGRRKVFKRRWYAMCMGITRTLSVCLENSLSTASGAFSSTAENRAVDTTRNFAINRRLASRRILGRACTKSGLERLGRPHAHITRAQSRVPRAQLPSLRLIHTCSQRVVCVQSFSAACQPRS